MHMINSVGNSLDKASAEQCLTIWSTVQLFNLALQGYSVCVVGQSAIQSKQGKRDSLRADLLEYAFSNIIKAGGIYYGNIKNAVLIMLTHMLNL